MSRTRLPSKPLLDTIDASGNVPPIIPPVKTTKARFWVLFVFCTLAICQSCTWNIYSPIFPAVFLAYPTWNSNYMNWLINSANISFGLSLYPVSVAIQKVGARKVTIFSSIMILSGAGLRCITFEDDNTQKIVQVIAMLCNGLGGAYLNFGGPIVSELWFPSNERTTATAIASVATYTGAALGFIVGPIIVGKPTTMNAAKEVIHTLYYGEAVVCLVSVLLCLLYFPDRPKHPPSEAALVKRETEQHRKQQQQNNYANIALYPGYTDDGRIGGAEQDDGDTNSNTGLFVYFSCSNKARKYWIISICMGLPLGVFQGWGATMFSCLKPLNFTQIEAAWLGFFTTAIGCGASVLVGAILDRFAGRLKLVTEICLIVATVSFSIFGINAGGYLNIKQHERVILAYITSIIGGAALNVSVPLFFELIMESIYGWADENIGSMVTILINTIIQIGFLIALAVMDSSISKIWTSWALAGSMLAAFSLMLFLKVDYRRLSVDKGKDLDETGSKFDRFGCY
jgi:FLVCR family MFS transporter